MDYSTSSFTDPRDNKTYKIVTIGTQTWLAENLNYECDGSKCYDNDPANAQKYGRLYNWETAKEACPPGWHLPSKYEWGILTDAIGGYQTEGQKLKAKSGWNEEGGGSGNGTDICGFSALPGGYGSSNGIFDDAGIRGYFWTASESYENFIYYRGMDRVSENATWFDDDKSYLYSVRCVKD